MEASAQEQEWQLGLAKQQQAAANRANRETPTTPETPSPAASTFENTMQLITRNAILQPLAIDSLGTFGIATFGLSWIGLFIYTLIKDLMFGIFGSPMADPGDLVFLIPPQTLQKFPKWLRTSTRIPARLVIYPMGLFVVMIYVVAIFAMLFPYLMIAGIIAEIAG